MRDVRSDLEERAHILEEQLRATYAHFDRMVQQLERDARISDLKDMLATIDKLTQFEARAMDNVVTLENPSPSQSLADRLRAVSG
jgi:hypothetical protein